MGMEPFLVNPPRRRRRKNPVGRSLLAFGLNPRRRKRKSKRNPLTRVKFPEHVSTLFRSAKTGKWGAKRRKKNPRKGAVPEHLKPFLFKKRRASPALKETHMAKRRKKSRRAKSRRRNPIPLGLNPRRRRRSRRNPVVLGLNPRRRRRSRNPLAIPRLGLPPMSEMAFLAGGAIAARTLVPRVLTTLPMLTKNPVVRGISRLAIVAGAAFAAKKALGANAKAFIYGALANQVPEALNDVLSLAGIKLSDGNAELELYTMSAGPEEIEARPTMGIYTLEEGDREEDGAVPIG